MGMKIAQLADGDDNIIFPVTKLSSITGAGSEENHLDIELTVDDINILKGGKIEDIQKKKYEKPSGGIPVSDLSKSVQDSLSLADTAIQPEGIEDLEGIVDSLSEEETFVLPYLHLTDSAPTSSSSTGVKGQVSFSDNYLYVCVETDTWVRINTETF